MNKADDLKGTLKALVYHNTWDCYNDEPNEMSEELENAYDELETFIDTAIKNKKELKLLKKELKQLKIMYNLCCNMKRNFYNELEELKRDVKRFFELINLVEIGVKNESQKNIRNEFTILTNKLSKVGVSNE